MTRCVIKMRGYASMAIALRKANEFIVRFDARKAAGDEPYWTWWIVAQDDRYFPMVHLGHKGNPVEWLGGPFYIIN